MHFGAARPFHVENARIRPASAGMPRRGLAGRMFTPCLARTVAKATSRDLGYAGNLPLLKRPESGPSPVALRISRKPFCAGRISCRTGRPAPARTQPCRVWQLAVARTVGICRQGRNIWVAFDRLVGVIGFRPGLVSPLGSPDGNHSSGIGMPHPTGKIKTSKCNPYIMGVRGLMLSSFGCLDFTATDGQRRGPR